MPELATRETSSPCPITIPLLAQRQIYLQSKVNTVGLKYPQPTHSCYRRQNFCATLVLLQKNNFKIKVYKGEIADVISLMPNPKFTFRNLLIQQPIIKIMSPVIFPFVKSSSHFSYFHVLFKTISLFLSTIPLPNTFQQSPNYKHKVTFRSIKYDVPFTSRPNNSALTQKFITAFVDLSISLDNKESLFQS
jgi:hypothetical protein